MKNIRQLESNQIENCKKIEVLDKNVQIYDNNIEEIETRLTNLTKCENGIKKNYNDIVSGSVNNPQKLLDFGNPDSLSDTFYNLFKENMKVHGQQVKSKLEELQTRKEKFFETLKTLLEQYDKELSAISEEINHLNNLNEEIEIKKNNALQLKKELNESNDTMAAQVFKNKKELEITFDEENNLIKEFQKILQRMKADINVSDITMDILFSPDKSNEKEESTEDQESAS
tara:strand:+ start:40 stop:726 length:687 start_codon:yes stop_codon:yes gene_type:complete